jgi:membrane protein
MVLPGRGISWKAFLVGVKDEWKKDRINDVAGALTFFALLALFPFMLFVVAVASLIINPADAQALVGQLSQVAPQQVTEIVGGRLEALGQQKNVGLLSFGFVAALWAASSGMAALIRALNIAYDVEEDRPYWKVRGLAIGMTLLTGAISLVAALVAIATPALADRLGGPLPTLVAWLRLPVAGLLMMLVWALLYYALPNAEQKFKFITPGSVVGVIAWVLASWGFSLYVANFGKYDATYGSLGAVIVLLVWMWISSQVLLLGAEINSFLEHRSAEGKRPGARRMADRGTTPTGRRRREPEPA